MLFGTPVLEYLPVPILTGIVVAALLIGITEFGLAVKLVENRPYGVCNICRSIF